MKKIGTSPSGRRLATIRRIIELPLLLQRRECSQSYLKQLYEVDGVTIRRDIRALSDYWPIKRERISREVIYSLPEGAKPTLRRIGRRSKK